MRKLFLFLTFALASLGLSAQPKSIYDFTMKSIDGQPVSLGAYSGKVTLVSTLLLRDRAEFGARLDVVARG